MSSGTLVVIDFGLLWMWSHTDPPRLDHADPELMERANSAVDLQVVGTDATLVAERIDLAAAKANFVFDMSPDSVEMVHGRVESIVDADGLDASVVEVPRMPHGDRVRKLLELHPFGAEVPFHGPWAVALSGLPVGRTLAVKGVRMPPDSPDAGRWRSVWIEIDDGPVVESTEAGHVLVDEARLMFCDVDALGEWEHTESLDGLYDVAFWGRDGDEVAELTGATQIAALGPGVFGWADLSFDEARAVATRVLGLQQEGELKFRAEVRPHSHHHDVLRQTATSPTESGSIDLADGRSVGFFTSWGDGAFPVFRDVASDGRLVRVRVELGSDEIVARSRRFDELWFGSLSKLAAVSAAVANDGATVGYLYRTATDRENDSGWCVLAGDESDEYLDDPANVVVMSLRDVIGFDDGLEQLFDRPAPVAFERSSSGELQECEPPVVRD